MGYVSESSGWGKTEIAVSCTAVFVFVSTIFTGGPSRNPAPSRTCDQIVASPPSSNASCTAIRNARVPWDPFVMTMFGKKNLVLDFGFLKADLIGPVTVPPPLILRSRIFVESTNTRSPRPFDPKSKRIDHTKLSVTFTGELFTWVKGKSLELLRSEATPPKK